MSTMTSLNVIKDEDNINILHVPPLDLPLEDKGVGCAIFKSMLKYKDRVAQVDATTGDRDTYDSLLQRCIRTAITMKSLEISADDIVTIFSSNNLNSIVPYIAAMFIGAKVSALDPSLSPNDIQHLLKEVTPKIIFISSECIKSFEESLKKLPKNTRVVAFGTIERYRNFSEFLLPKTQEEENEFKPREIENLFETAAIFFSSGLGGLTKGICVNHYTILSQAFITMNCGFCFDKSLLAAHVYWSMVACYIFVIILSGSTNILLDDFSFDNICNTIDKYKPTMATIDTYTLCKMASNLPKHIDISSLQHITPGGTPITEKQVSTIKETFDKANLYRSYGQTETFFSITAFNPSSEEDHILMYKSPTSCGRPIPGFSYAVVDPDTENIVGPYQQGELRLKTKYLLNGYYNQDSSHLWDKNGWYKTGDTVYYDNDHCFYIVDRIKELLKYQEYHVLPVVIEKVLKSHPAVDSAIVIGIPHEVDGDHPMAIVVLKESCKDTSPEIIKEFVDKRVDDRKRLRGGVKIVDAIPVAPNGRIDRRSVKNMVLQGKL